MQSNSEQKKVRTKNIYEQGFDKLMMLMRIDRILKKTVITHKKK
ncbi:MAG: hypothetical protein JWO58_1705 [Chitinophagaceae bacterium]|nr:hypothetical protein [Chitinophagaceae bacterium]